MEEQMPGVVLEGAMTACHPRGSESLPIQPHVGTRRSIREQPDELRPPLPSVLFYRPGTERSCVSSVAYVETRSPAGQGREWSWRGNPGSSCGARRPQEAGC
jgi:hypothetical protein